MKTPFGTRWLGTEVRRLDSVDSTSAEAERWAAAGAAESVSDANSRSNARGRRGVCMEGAASPCGRMGG